MFITSISLHNFKKFASFSAKFTGDFTVVKGPNEQGKSTLLFALLAGLFYDPKKSNKDILALKSWQSDRMYDITLEFEHNGEQYALVKNFETKEGSLENLTTKERWMTHGDVAKQLFALGALRSLALFERTACVRHDALAGVAEGKKEISRTLEELMTASGEHVSADKVIATIDNELTALQKGMRGTAKTPGLLVQLETEIAELAAKRQAIEEELSRASAAAAHYAERDRVHGAVAAKCAAVRGQHERNAVYFKTTEELKQLTTQFDTLNADVLVVQDVAAKKEYITRELEHLRILPSVDMNALYALREQLAVRKEKLAYATAEKKEMSTGHRMRLAHIKPVHAAVSLVLLGAGLLGFFDPRLFIFLGLFVIAASYSFILRKGITVHTRAAVDTDAERLEHEIAVMEKQLAQTFAVYGVTNEKELLEKVKKYNALGQEHAKLESKEEGILRGKTLAALIQEKNECARRVAVAESTISAEERVHPPAPGDQRMLEVSLRALEQEAAQGEKELRDAGAALAARASREDFARCEEALEMKRRSKENAERKLATLMELKDALAEAQKKTIAASRAQIESYLEKYLAAVTDGRYRRVRVNDDLSFVVWSDEKNDMIVPEDHLSRGTIDQFYLIARLAVLSLLNKGTKSLLPLDDPFHAFDAVRRERARRILTDATSAFQVILFTHSSDYDTWGNVIEI
ncbi:MAG: AAA family ATPase [Patescibacteria group bacterium]